MRALSAQCRTESRRPRPTPRPFRGDPTSSAGRRSGTRPAHILGKEADSGRTRPKLDHSGQLWRSLGQIRTKSGQLRSNPANVGRRWRGLARFRLMWGDLDHGDLDRNRPEVGQESSRLRSTVGPMRLPRLVCGVCVCVCPDWFVVARIRPNTRVDFVRCWPESSSRVDILGGPKLRGLPARIF